MCEVFSPTAIVVQCGADILKGDPIGGCNITLNAMGVCFKSILDKNIPTLVLGGGTYLKHPFFGKTIYL